MESKQRTGERRGPRRVHVVERAEAYVHTHIAGPLLVSRLCRAIGVSERELRDAFRFIRGVSPKGYIDTERMLAVRRALTDRSRRPASVTAAATNCGFYELGRFAGSYRRAFGESPSETLRGSRR